MNGLDTPPVWWNADTAKPGAGNTGLAAIPSGVVKSQRKHPAMKSEIGFKDCRFARSRQEGSWSGASALQIWRA